MSGGADLNGQEVLPKPLCGAVVSTKNTIMVPCMVTSARYCSGVITPPLMNGKCAPGQTRWKRISTDSTIPMQTAASASRKYWMPMTL